MVPQRGAALSRTASGWRLVDRMLAGYGLVIAVVALGRLDQRGIGWIVAAHAALPLLAWLATRAPREGTGAILRGAYPVVILLGLYASLDVLNGFGSVPVHDAPLLRLEQALFGMQPARDWWRAAPSRFWSTLLHAVYFSYYVIVPLPLLVLAAGRRWDEMGRYLDGVIAVFLACYLCYVAWPVAGPYYEFARPTGTFVANLPARLVYGTLSGGSSYGAAFPSSHVAATLAAALGGWRVSRRLGIVLLVPALLLAVAVVYCQMHYVVDSAAGLVVGTAVPLAVDRWRVRARR
ncbi:MAG: phosphatase PAP2 family protein [Gemmatimonadales bacterium]